MKDFLNKLKNNKLIIKIDYLLRKLSSNSPIGGLRVMDSSVQFVEFKNSKIIQSSFRLPPGIIENGRLVDTEQFIEALKEMRNRITSNPRKILQVVLSIPINDVYLQSFKLPGVAEANVDEAVELNLQMISPINIEDAYYSWQETDNDKTGGQGQIEILGVFALRSIVDTFVNSLQKAGFAVAAVEFSSISLVRDMIKKNIIVSQKPYLVIEITTSGMNFIIARNGAPNFHYLYPWKEIQGDERVISAQSFKIKLNDEIEKMLNFHSTHWNEENIKDIIVVSPALKKEILEVTSDNKKFSGFNIKVIGPQVVSVASGAAFRGSIPRSKDAELNLASIGTIEAFRRDQVMEFIATWRNILFTTFGFLLVLFLVSSIFLKQASNKVIEKGATVLSTPKSAELQVLQNRANEFNSMIVTFNAIRSQRQIFSQFIDKMYKLAGDKVVINHFGFKSLAQPITVNGTANDEAAAIEFKNRLNAVSQFSNVKLPLNGISRSGDEVLFTINFNLLSLKF